MSTIAVERAIHDKAHPFALISSAVARTLPVEALGMLVKLLTFADGWEIDRDRLQRDFAVKPGELKRLLPNLVKRGHLKYERPRNQKTHQFNGSATWKVIELPAAATSRKSHMEEIDHVEIDDVDSGHVEIDAAESQQVDFGASHGTRAESNILDSNISKDSDIQEIPSLRAHTPAHEDEREISFAAPIHPLLVDFVPKLGEPDRHAALLEAEIARLGTSESRAVLLGCGNAGSWQYILTAVQRRKTPADPPPISALPPSATVMPHLGGLWATACSVVPDTHVRRALTYGATISESNLTDIRIEAAPFDGDLLAEDCVQAALDIMRDMDITVEIVQQPIADRVGAA